MYPRIAYVTSATDSDQEPALAAFERAHLEGWAGGWEEQRAWDDFDLVLVRAADPERRTEFLKWARQVEEQTLLANPARVLARNSDRTYLRDLAHHGVPTVQTLWFEPGDDARVLDLEQTGWHEFVVSPNIRGLMAPTLCSDPVAAVQRATELAARGWVAMIQPRTPTGLSVIFLGGAVSHASAEIPERAAELLPAITAAYGEELLQARVDLVEQDDGWVLEDVNATDPELLLDATAADRLARAVRTLLSPPVVV